MAKGLATDGNDALVPFQLLNPENITGTMPALLFLLPQVPSRSAFCVSGAAVRACRRR